ncbi:MAG: hypothetical protein NTW87_29945 [Planctomycetota bacterium]|nr:hypothetical protein [Planctomycetota bacterium]
MRAQLFATLLALAGLNTWGIAAGESGPAGATVEAQGLRIVKPSPGGNDKLRAFNWFSGTTLALLVTVPQGGLVSFDRDASKVTSFADDKGKDLTKSDGKGRFMSDKAGFEMMPNFSEDGKQCTTDVRAPGVPAQGATKLAVAGELVFQIATQKKDFAAENVALKADTKVAAGPIPFTITKVGKPEWGGDEAAFCITLEAKQDLSSVADIQFQDAAGKKIEGRRGSTSRMGFMNNVTITWEYNLKAKADAARIVITYWTDMKKVTVPFALNVGVGL